ncbi:alpha-L-fucosidase [Marinilongibacter aquaticus]|uniref:alpha-L-fucosidase n=1 Tax=Marinilongibacter aquaticus TaxID=2975157 RepID=UPI0021BD6557|nr:alpha-L-fucosidase [Marinilongibacter aquaticus]UBM60194.1 alpha-L-fucosidase [Marinilongibacter aquaticus]
MKKILILICLIAQTAFAQYEANWESLDTRKTPEWFENAKFGIFIHWGVYSVPSWATKSNADGFGSGYSEWYWERLNNKKLKIHKEFVDFHQKNYGNKAYQEFAQDFKAELFEPEKWAEIFKDAGAKYVVLTSKHHEGFAMWPTKTSWNWNAGDIGPRRDLAGDLSKAVKDEGLHMGFYYSLYEWYNPTYLSDVDEYVDKRMLPQMKELVTKYNPDVLWTDGEWGQSAKTWRSEEFLAWLFNDSPVKNTIAVNDRWGNDTRGGHGGFATSEYGHGGEGLKEGGYSRPWEECRGMGESFGYNRNENLENYQTGEALVHELISTVSRGGNLLLNIGPTGDGRIPVIMQERLHEIGAWLKVNGEAIYGSRRGLSDLELPKEVYTTTKDGNVYVIMNEWQDALSLKGLSGVKKVSMLGYDGAVDFNTKKGELNIKSPKFAPNEVPCAYAWVYKLEM